ncbi:MAG: hypothetical protein U0821_16700 [Chloroflexota bacterium]
MPLPWAIAYVALVGYLLIYLDHVRTLAAYPFDFDQGEGYDLNSGWLIAQGRPIYTDNASYPYYSSNYPPVFSYLLAAIVSSTGPQLAAGRLLSAASAILAAIVIGACAFRVSGRGALGGLAGLFFVASSYVYHVTPLSRVNATALLIALLGLAAARCGGLVGALLAAVLFVAALFTKQTMADAVAAGLLALFLARRYLGVLATSLVLVLGGTCWAVLDGTHGGSFFTNAFVGNVNPFSVFQAVAYYRNFLETHGILVGLAAFAVYRSARARSVGAFELYWAASMGLALTVGKWGAGESYFLAPIAATCILATRPLAWALDAGRARPLTKGIVGGLLMLQVVLLAHGPLYAYAPILADRGAQASVLGRAPGAGDVAEGMRLVARIQKESGPVLAEDPGYALAAGRDVVGNATHLRNLHQAGAWDSSALIGDLERRRFAFVILDAELYPEPVLAAIGRYYYLYDEFTINDTRQKLFAPGAQ